MMIPVGTYLLCKLGEGRGFPVDSRTLRVIHYPFMPNQPVYGYVKCRPANGIEWTIADLLENRIDPWASGDTEIWEDNRAVAQCFWRLMTGRDTWYHRNGYTATRIGPLNGGAALDETIRRLMGSAT